MEVYGWRLGVGVGYGFGVKLRVRLKFELAFRFGFIDQPTSLRENGSHHTHLPTQLDSHDRFIHTIAYTYTCTCQIHGNTCGYSCGTKQSRYNKTKQNLCSIKGHHKILRIKNSKGFG